MRSPDQGSQFRGDQGPSLGNLVFSSANKNGRRAERVTVAGEWHYMQGRVPGNLSGFLLSLFLGSGITPCDRHMKILVRPLYRLLHLFLSQPDILDLRFIPAGHLALLTDAALQALWSTRWECPYLTCNVLASWGISIFRTIMCSPTLSNADTSTITPSGLTKHATPVRPKVWPSRS